MRALTAVLAVSAFCVAANAQPPGGTAAGAAPRSDALDRFLANVETLRADFEQSVYSAEGSLIERYTGTMAVERPGRFLWHYAPPMELILWADGETFNTYDVELEQHTIAPLDDYSASAPVLLSGGAELDEVFDVVRTYTDDGLEWVELVPVADGGGEDIASLAIAFDGAAPRRIEFVDSTDETTRIELTGVAVNVDVPDALFAYEPPPEATVLGGR